MKTFAAVAMALLMTGMTVMAQDSNQAMASRSEMRTGQTQATQQLKDLEQRWVQASLGSDGAALGPLLAEDFVNINSDGSVLNKTQTMDRTMKSKWQVSELSEIQVTEHGDSAVVTGIWHGKGTDSTGKAVDARERWADTWVKRNGQWQCVASASAPLS